VNKLWRTIGLLAVALGFLAAWSLAYFTASVVFLLTGTPSSSYLQLLIISVLGVIIVFLSVGVLTLLKRSPRPPALFQSMSDTIGQIAKGNFEVKLTLDDRHLSSTDNPIGGLVTSINDMAAQLQHIETMRQEFISNVSHEIQSPLTSIGGFAKALRNPKLSDSEKQHYLDIIETESERVSKLSDNLLKLASLESELHPFEPHPYRLDRQLRSVVLSCRPQWVAKNVELNVELPEVILQADEDLLSQVWVNLLSNAVKFAPNGGTISVHLVQRNEEVIVSISDNGLGIANEDKKRIFERFYKVDSSRRNATEGSGLGLSIVRKIVEMHRGAVDVKSTLGEGTTFIVHLPRKLTN
jgi:two-component system, OmpR family, phosphate regulon sensor histidine kinase PhoR